MNALLAGILDYAGMFPPAGLPLEMAVANWRTYRKGPDAGLLGRFVCPANRLADLAKLGWSNDDGAVAAILPAAKVERGAFDGLELADTVEAIWSPEAIHFAPPDKTVYFELPGSDAGLPDDAFENKLKSALAAIAKRGGQGGFKFRTGVAHGSKAPSSQRLATVIAACRDADVFWKATGGLHQPWRHVDKDLGVPVHGFVNVLTAVALAHAKNLDVPAIASLLEGSTNACGFATGSAAEASGPTPELFGVAKPQATFDDAVGELCGSLSPEQVAVARRAFRSFGSCSFDEPRQHLEALGWS